MFGWLADDMAAATAEDDDEAAAAVAAAAEDCGLPTLVGGGKLSETGGR